MTVQTGNTTLVLDPAPEVAPSDAPEAVHPQTREPDSWKEVLRLSIPSRSCKCRSVILRLGLVTWSFLLVVLTALVVGGAVGGGLGASFVDCQSHTSQTSNLNSPSTTTATNPTTTPTSASNNSSMNNVTCASNTNDLSNYKAAAPDTVSLLSTSCPSSSSTRYTTRSSENFTITCGVDSRTGGSTLEDPSKSLQVRAGLIAYSLDDCMEACSAYNAFNARNGDTGLRCKSISWDRRLQETMIQKTHVNCWLKNGTLSADQLTEAENVAIAVIQ